MTASPISSRSVLLRRVERIRRERSVILGYHGVAAASVAQDLHLLLVSPGRFRAHLELLRDAGFQFVTVAELAAMADGGAPPAGFAAVSFDDGMRNNLTVALPILRELGIRASVYVVSSFIGGRSPWTGPRIDSSILTAPELRELAGAGWEVGAHTVSHADLSALDYDGCRREIAGSRAAIEEIVGVPVRTMAYPFGRYGAAAMEASRDCGLLAALAAGSGSWAPHEMHRAMIGAIDPMPIVVLKLADGYEPMLRLAPVKVLRTASKHARRQLQGLLWRQA